MWQAIVSYTQTQMVSSTPHSDLQQLCLCNVMSAKKHNLWHSYFFFKGYYFTITNDLFSWSQARSSQSTKEDSGLDKLQVPSLKRNTQHFPPTILQLKPRGASLVTIIRQLPKNQTAPSFSSHMVADEGEAWACQPFYFFKPNGMVHGNYVLRTLFINKGSLWKLNRIKPSL